VLAAVFHQPKAEPIDTAKRRSQIVRYRVRKGLEFLVGDGQLRGSLRHPLLQLVVQPSEILPGPDRFLEQLGILNLP